MNAEAAQVHIRRMNDADLDQVMGIAAELKDAPHWPRAVYVAALGMDATQRRIALVAEQTFPQGLKPVDSSVPSLARLKPRPFKARHLTALGRIAGFAIASLLPPQAELESIAVLAAEQRRGIGRNLFFAMVEELGTEGVREVLLEVRASNQRARDFYRSLGWTEIGRRPRYYADPEEDAVQMSLKLE